MGRKKQHKSRMYRLVGEPGPGARVVGYVRYSSDMQRSATIETQKRAIEKLAAEKGWILVSWYEEPAHSAKYEEIERRPIFAQLLKDAGVLFQVVLCYNTSRWARSNVVTGLSLSELRRKGVWWGTTSQGFTIDSILEPGPSLVHVLTAQTDQDYLVQLSKVTIDGLENRGQEGFHNGPVPFGYRRPAYPTPPEDAPSTWKPPRMPARPDPVTFPALVRLGELVAAGWSDVAIADELASQGVTSKTARFGVRPLTKDTVASIRRLWFPKEFAPGCGHGTIETPSGELVEGKHPAAWPYDLWQRMFEAKAGQFRRGAGNTGDTADTGETDGDGDDAEGGSMERRARIRHPHAFSRIIVCAACRRPLRVQPYPSGLIYYRDTSAVRKLPCPTGGFRLVNSTTVLEQFGDLLSSVTLPNSWRGAIAARCAAEAGRDDGNERARIRRAELEAERQRLVSAFAKGYLPEEELDAQVTRIRAELQALPPPAAIRSVEDTVAAAVTAGETLADMAGYWEEATAEERRDIVWALLPVEGLIYDLERRAIAGLLPRPDVLPVLALGLEVEWERRDDGGLWRRDLAALPLIAHTKNVPPPTPFALTPEQQEQALALARQGLSLRKIAAHFPGVSYGAIWRLLRARWHAE
jgi:DNA invertase Pin-like site-specific DNA recombinase